MGEGASRIRENLAALPLWREAVFRWLMTASAPSHPARLHLPRDCTGLQSDSPPSRMRPPLQQYCDFSNIMKKELSNERGLHHDRRPHFSSSCKVLPVNTNEYASPDKMNQKLKYAG
jgi:hypothetical protein